MKSHNFEVGQRVSYAGDLVLYYKCDGEVEELINKQAVRVMWDDGRCTTHRPSALKHINKLDAVDKPAHYQFFPDLEAIEVIARSMTQEQFYGYCLGNRLKYRLRAGNKDKLEQDIAKSDKYIELYEQHKQKCLDAK